MSLAVVDQEYWMMYFNGSLMKKGPPVVVDLEYWMMYFNGSLMKKGAGVGLVFVSPLKVHMRYMVRIHFPSSNNVAEYQALINGLCIAVELGI